MSTILNIDTSFESASVSLSRHGERIALIENGERKEHASFLQPAIQTLCAQQEMLLKNIDAVAIVNGPGSYTGLRVGLASAKGICYALNKPLITISSLQLMAKAAILELKKNNLHIPLLCPMIDARRMEVFTALYNSSLNEIISPRAIILNYDSFVANLLQDEILFFGDGANKFKQMANNSNALFSGSYSSHDALCDMSFQMFSSKQFADLAYSEPYYLKEFYNG